MARDNLLRRRIERFIAAGAPRGAAVVLAAQVEIPEDEAAELLERGMPADRVLQLLSKRLAPRPPEA